MSTIFEKTLSASATQRILEIEDRDSNDLVKNDWVGTRRGTWVKLNQDGTGTVSVEGRNYTCLVRAARSIRAGTFVDVYSSEGQYIASW